MLALSSVVVFVTTYAMILPAITLEQTKEMTEEVQMSDMEGIPVTAAENETETQALAPDPKNITMTLLYYKESTEAGGTGTWEEVTGNETLAGNTKFRIKIAFKDIGIQALKGADYAMTCTLPEFFKYGESIGQITDGSDKAADVNVKAGENKVTVTFTKDWLDKQAKDSLEGDFFVEGVKADLKKYPEGGEKKIEELDKTIRFEEDLLAKYGEITLKKTQTMLIQNETGDYLEYTIKVTAGEDGCPEVVVKDQFTANAGYVDSYEVISPAGTLFEKDSEGNRVWNLGTMNPNTEQTLTYRVKLKPEYLGIKQTKPLTNQATPYLKGSSGTQYEREGDTATFEPKAEGTMLKISSDYDPASHTITYAVWVQALSTNNYTLDNVVIKDSLDGSVAGGNKTAKEFLDYLTYMPNSFALYEGGSEKLQISEVKKLEKTEAQPAPVISTDQKYFTCPVGSLAPGEGKTLIYQVKVSDGIFAQSNGEIYVENRATFYPEADYDHSRLNNYNDKKLVGSKKWTGKLSNGPTTEETTFSTGSGESFTVPAGSYQYQVAVNEAGDWDVTSAEMHDKLQGTLGESKLQYVGYLKIDAYKIPDNQKSDSATTAAAVAKLSKLTAEKTGWIKIDGQQSFTLTPKDLKKAGLPESGEYAYLLTYYAKPVNMGGVSGAKVTNTFSLSGEVVKDQKKYPLGDNIQSETTVTVQGTNYFTAQKKFWYDDEAAADRSLYWILSVNGKTIPKETSLKDAIGTGTGIHKIDGVVKAFIGSSSLDFSKVTDLDKITGVQAFTAYQTGSMTDSALELTLTADITPGDGNSLYFIIRTKPDQEELPSGKGAYKTYKNELSTKDPGSTSWVHQSEDSYNLYKLGHIYKETAGVFKATPEQLTGNQVTYFSDPTIKDMAIQYDHLRESGGGTYVAWSVTVNKAGDLSGRHRVVEQIPAGMEVVYVQRYSFRGSEKTFVQQPDLINQGYEECIKIYSAYDRTPTPAYYYVKGQEVIWDVEGLQSGSGEQHVVFLVVCRLTDQEVLLGGESKEFVNQVSLLDSQGNSCGLDSANVTLSAPQLKKTGQPLTGAVYQYTVTLNELGTDLAPGSDQITLVDEMCDLLTLKPGTIKVVKTGTTEEQAYTAAVEGHTLSITLPDNLPLTVTYEVYVHALPGQQVSISNKAHWEGFPNNGYSEVKQQFSYSGGTVNANDNPTLTITKTNQYNINELLSGAEFKLEEMELSDNQLVPKVSGYSKTETTNEAGVLSFGKDSTKLDFETVYRLTETKAPEGYVLDSEPKYFLFANPNNTNADYSQYEALGVLIVGEKDHSRMVTNHKGEIQVTKSFTDAAGNPLGKKLVGTYTFGLFESGPITGTPLQKASIRFENGGSAEQTAKFTNVELGKTYVVYELADDGTPIKDGKDGTVSGIPFVVSYDTTSITVTADNPTKSVTVTNRMNYAQLPETGGYGTYGYTIGGALLSLGAAGLLCHKIKRKRSGDDLLA